MSAQISFHFRDASSGKQKRRVFVTKAEQPVPPAVDGEIEELECKMGFKTPTLVTNCLPAIDLSRQQPPVASPIATYSQDPDTVAEWFFSLNLIRADVHDEACAPLEAAA